MHIKEACPANCKVVVSDCGLGASYDSRGRASSQAILQHELENGMTFVMTLSGPGVLKVGVFSSKAVAKDWFRSGRCLPKGCRRVRNPENEVLVVSVFRDQIVCTPTNSSTAAFSIKYESARCTLAFDVECGDIKIVIRPLMLYGQMCRCQDSNHDDAFDDISPFLQKSLTANGWQLKAHVPLPSSVCLVPDLVLSPGTDLNLLVMGTKKVTDTGAYIRIWLMPPDWSGGCSNPEPIGSRMIYVGRKSTVEYHLRMKDNKLLVYSNTSNGSTRLDSISVALNRCQIILAFEIYKVSFSIKMKDPSPVPQTQGNSTEVLLHAPPEGLPRPHQHPHHPRRNEIPPTELCDPRSDSGQVVSEFPYLTPVTAAENKQCHCWEAHRTALEDKGRLHTASSCSQNKEVLVRTDMMLVQPQDQLTSEDEDRTYTRNGNIYYKIKPSSTLPCDCYKFPVQVSCVDSDSLDETDVKKLYAPESIEIDGKPSMLQMTDDKVKAFDDNVADGNSNARVQKDECTQTSKRISQFNSNDAHHQTILKQS